MAMSGRPARSHASAALASIRICCPSVSEPRFTWTLIASAPRRRQSSASATGYLSFGSCAYRVDALTCTTMRSFIDGPVEQPQPPLVHDDRVGAVVGQDAGELAIAMRVGEWPVRDRVVHRDQEKRRMLALEEPTEAKRPSSFDHAWPQPS